MLDQFQVSCPGDSLKSIFGVQFVENVTHMGFSCVEGDDKLRSDVVIGEVPGQEAKHLEFSCAQDSRSRMNWDGTNGTCSALSFIILNDLKESGDVFGRDTAVAGLTKDRRQQPAFVNEGTHVTLGFPCVQSL